MISEKLDKTLLEICELFTEKIETVLKENPDIDIGFLGWDIENVHWQLGFAKGLECAYRMIENDVMRSIIRD